MIAELRATPAAPPSDSSLVPPGVQRHVVPVHPPQSPANTPMPILQQHGEFHFHYMHHHRRLRHSLSYLCIRRRFAPGHPTATASYFAAPSIREMVDARTIVSLAHVFVLAPLLYIIATTDWISATATAALGIFITLYHAYKVYAKAMVGAPYWVNLVHVLVVGPLVAAKGLLHPAPRYVNELILMTAAAGFGYHAYYLLVPQ